MPTKKKAAKKAGVPCWTIKWTGAGMEPGPNACAVDKKSWPIDPRWCYIDKKLLLDDYERSFGSHPKSDGNTIVRVEVREL